MSKKIVLICSNFSKNEIKGNLKKIFLHFLNMACEFESQVNNLKKEARGRSQIKKVGRPEILTLKQKEIVLDKFKKGKSVYALAKEFDVTRTVIQRILDKYSENLKVG